MPLTTSSKTERSEDQATPKLNLAKIKRKNKRFHVTRKEKLKTKRSKILKMPTQRKNA